MEIIRGYGLRPKPQRLLHMYWDGQKVVLEASQHGYMSDNGGTGILKSLQHSSEYSGQGGPPGGLCTPGGIAWVRMGGGQIQHLRLRR